MIACEEIQNYINLVRSGTIVVCEEQILLCDLVESRFDTETLTVDIVQLGKYLGMQKYFPFRLFDWEAFCFTLHNCVYTSAGALRWPDLFILVGRGAGKNGYLSFEDFCLISEYNGVKDYHIDICANAEDQARMSFDDVHAVLEANEARLRSYFSWTKELITNRKTGSQLRFRTANFKTKTGGRPGKVDFDELHQYLNYLTLNVFKTGLGKKKHPRTTTITTNGDVRDGPLDHLIAKSMQILTGKQPDNGLLPFICKLDSAEEVDDPAMWGKANPSLAFFPDLQRIIAKEYVEFKDDPVSHSGFMTMRMNIPQGNKDMEVTSWDNILTTGFVIEKDEKGREISRIPRIIPDLGGCTCVVGVDYMSTTDFLTAGLLFLYKGIHYWLSHSWVCTRCNDLGRIKAPLKEWEAAGFLTFVDAVEVSPDIPAAWLADQAGNYNITTLCIDKYRFTLLTRALREHGFDADRTGGVNNIKLIRPSDQMQVSPIINSLFANHGIVWGDNPLMRWYVNNSMLTTSTAGNITYGKIEGKSRKTDGFMAFIMAVCGAADLVDSGDMVEVNFGTYTY